MNDELNPNNIDPTQIINPAANAGGNNVFDPTQIVKPAMDPTQVAKPDMSLGGAQEAPREASAEEIMLDISAEEQVMHQSKRERGKKIKKINNVFDLFEAVNLWMINSSKVKLQDKLIFFELLGATINAGVSVTEALRMIEVQTKAPKLRFVIRDIRFLIEDGNSLAQAFKQNNDIFDEATIAIIEAGEKSGKLNEVLRELIKQYERMSGIRKKVLGVMMYPIIVIVFIVILIVVVLILVVPKLVGIFGSVENLPLPTQILVYGSDLFRTKWIPMVIVLVAAGTGFNFWRRSHTGARQLAILIIHIPIMGMLMRDMILSRITRIFGFLLSSGVPIIESLKIAANVARHPVYEDKLLLASDDMEKGISLGENLQDNEKLFPMMLVNMISIGEKTASLENIMGKIADFYDDELDRKVSNLSKMMEPIILLIISVMAIFMILAIYLPITQLNDQFINGS